MIIAKNNTGNDIGWKLAIPGWQEGEMGRGKNGTAAFQNSGVRVCTAGHL